jgi:hypothetical protein
MSPKTQRVSITRPNVIQMAADAIVGQFNKPFVFIHVRRGEKIHACYTIYVCRVDSKQ